jgi:UDP-glucuronate 4-epimerase
MIGEMSKMKTVLVTGAAGFIGFHLCARLLRDGYRVVGLDNFSDYYDPQLKHARLRAIRDESSFAFHAADLGDRSAVAAIFEEARPTCVINLAAQAGVRYSIKNPYPYVESNIVGFLNVLEGCRRYVVEHLVFSSSSSVYGANTHMPFSTHDNVDHPVSLYAATKKSNELMAHSYSYLYGLPCTGLRLFTVYGPWGRPDMSYFKFTRAILEGKPIEVFNHGNMQRDFTYVDDIVAGITAVMNQKPKANPNWDSDDPAPESSYAPYRIYNIGNNKPVPLSTMIQLLETALGRKAIKNYLPMQDGDVPVTYADIDDLTAAVGFRPQTSIEEGLPRFVAWYRDYYKV